MSKRTLVLCKPDAVERRLVGEIVGRIERKQLTIVAMELRKLDEETAHRHYNEHREKPFFGDLVSFITRGPLVALVVEGGPDTWQVVRNLMGVTNPREAAPGTFSFPRFRRKEIANSYLNFYRKSSKQCG